MKKKVDSRIQILIEQIIKQNQRGLFIIIGDRGRDQVVNLHYLLTKHQNKIKPKVLWCYKKELGFSSHRKKRAKEIKKLQHKGLYNENQDDPFEVFISSTDVRYCYYKESHKILGNTYNLLVLQDFESLTPNILCRTVETIEGGGLIIMLIKTMDSLRQLYNLCMDVHSRFRTDQFDKVEPRFNERFMLSLAKCTNSLVMDDELNILPISTTINSIVKDDTVKLDNNHDLQLLKDSFKLNHVIYQLVSMAKTIDQAKAIMIFFEVLNAKQYRTTVSLTAARGRGKSAATGIAIAAAVITGLSNIFVTAPNPENLNTLFQFCIQALENLGYQENLHFTIIQSTNPDFNNAIIRINIFKTHRQIIQYILPTDYNKLSSTDLLVIDEAAAIPLIYVQQLLGPYLVFLSSTINGYEGTGRSLSLKLLNKLREQNKFNTGETNINISGDRILKEIELIEPIRYSNNDPIEQWLYDLLILNGTNVNKLTNGLPHPNNCQLYMVNRDTLFSYKTSSEQFLFNLMSLFIGSHYKNSPNDLQMISDAPAHAIFVLLGPLENNNNNNDKKGVTVPDVLCAIQVCFEGNIRVESRQDNKQRSIKPAGDLIPWTISDQFQDDSFAGLSGLRVVRIATHPHATKTGYGTKALELLSSFFEGKLISIDHNVQMQPFFQPSAFIQYTNNNNDKINLNLNLIKEEVKPNRKLQPLLRKLSEISPPQLNWIGVSYGLTRELYQFWKKNKFQPIYIRQTKNDLTAEHTCIMIKSVQQENNEIQNQDWIDNFSTDFQRRFTKLLSYEFQALNLSLSLNILNPNLTTNSEEDNSHQVVSKELLQQLINLHDLRRLAAYKSNMIDYHIILDLLPTISQLFFLKKLHPTTKISYSQAAILTGMGLQHKSVDQIAEELNIPANQILALFNKTIRKLYNSLQEIYEKDMDNQISQNQVINQTQFKPLKQDLNEEIQKQGQQILTKIDQKNKIKQQDEQNNIKQNKRQHLYELNMENEELDEIVDPSQLKKYQNLIIPRKKDKYDDKDERKKKVKK